MHTVNARAGRRPLALTLLGLVALTAACTDEPVAPRPAPRPDPGTPAFQVEEIQVTVTNASGGDDVGSLQWAAAQISNSSGNSGGVITFDPSLAGVTITLDAPLDARRPTTINGPAKGITISGNDQHRVITGGTSLTLRNLTLTKGYADLGSAVQAPSLSLYNTTVEGNRGPAAAVYGNDALRLVNSTVSGNTVERTAVEYGPYAQVMIDNSTIASNAPGAGFGPISPPGAYIQVTLRNSILANNGSPLRNCSTYAGLSYQGTNVVNDWSCADVAITPTDPQLMPLAYNGGPNRTHAIPHTSPAYNTGVDCTQTTDQRYVARDAKCDVGAFEFNDFTRVTISIDPTVKLDASGTALLTGTIACTRADTFRLAVELHQNQRVGKQLVDIHAASDIPVTCATTAKPWSAAMGLAAGEAFQNGAASATTMTFQTPEWLTPASASSAVKISVARPGLRS